MAVEMSIQEYIRKRPEKDSFQTAMFIYESALIQMASRLEILNNELNHVYSYNPIEYIRTRLKTPESITKKLRKNGHNISIDDMVEHVHDIAGLRITCSFYSEIYFLADMIARQDNLKVVSITKKLRKNGHNISIDDMVEHVHDIAGLRITCSFYSEIYFLADMIARQDNLKVVSIKDYISHPKESGYKSYHMILCIQVALADAVVPTNVELQIRTMAMDFWASLEHKIYYKYEGNAPDYFSRELKECASIISKLDGKMMSLNEAMKKIDGG